MSLIRGWMEHRSLGKSTCCSAKSATLVTIAIAIILVTSINFTMKIFPEIELTAKHWSSAQCSNMSSSSLVKPLDELLRDVRLTKKLFGLKRKMNRTQNNIGEFQAPSNRQRKVIIWGTHHKTGTFLARKIFATVCNVMNWCCAFHVTHDTLVDVQRSLSASSCMVVGHNQWKWLPSDLFGPENDTTINYRFVHFYRHPMRKILSGYRYHRSGVEDWTKRRLYYESLMNHSMIYQSSSIALDHVCVDSRMYCRAIHLCEHCCLLELARSQTTATKELCQVTTTSDTHNRLASAIRKDEFDVIQRFIGRVNVSLTSSLLTEPIATGLGIEASLDYYETRRMAWIWNKTNSDSRTLHVDLDEVMDSFEAGVRRIVAHLELGMSKEAVESLVQQLQFYDSVSSPVYRWSMTSSLFNHIDTSRISASKDIQKSLEENQDIMKLYQPVFELLGTD